MIDRQEDSLEEYDIDPKTVATIRDITERLAKRGSEKDSDGSKTYISHETNSSGMLVTLEAPLESTATQRIKVDNAQTGVILRRERYLIFSRTWYTIPATGAILRQNVPTSVETVTRTKIDNPTLLLPSTVVPAGRTEVTELEGMLKALDVQAKASGR